MDPQLEKRTVIARAKKKLEADAPSIFEPEEDAFLFREPLGVGCWIGFRSIRHRELVDLLAKNYFQNLDRYVYDSLDGRVWVRFGYDLHLRILTEIEELSARLHQRFLARYPEFSSTSLTI